MALDYSGGIVVSEKPSELDFSGGFVIEEEELDYGGGFVVERPGKRPRNNVETWKQVLSSYPTGTQSIVAGLYSSNQRFKSIMARTFGDEPRALKHSRNSSEVHQAVAETGGLLETGIAGAAESLSTMGVLAPSVLAGPAGLPAVMGVMEFNDSLSEGKEAGLEGFALVAGYAAPRGLTEGFLTYLFNVKGGGAYAGLEGGARQAVAQGWKNAAVTVSKHVAGELAEETYIGMAGAVIDVLSGVNLEALNLKNLGRMVNQIVVTTAITMGAAEGIRGTSTKALQTFRNRPTRKTAAALPESTRDAIGETGLDLSNSGDRKAFAGLLTRAKQLGVDVTGATESQLQVRVAKAQEIAESEIESEEPTLGSEAGFIEVDVGALDKLVSRGQKLTGKLVRRWLKTGKGLTDTAADIQSETVGRFALAGSAVNRSEKILARALKKEYGSFSKIAVEQQAVLNDALGNYDLIANLPEGLQDPVRRMRSHIDQMSDVGLEIGVFQGRLRGRVEANKGFYVHDTYRIFTDKKHAKKTLKNKKVMDRARFLIREQIESGEMVSKTPEQIEGLIQSILRVGEAKEAGQFQNKSISNRDMSVLMKKGELSEVVKLLWHKENDIFTVYRQTVAAQVSNFEMYRMGRLMREAGLGTFFFDEGSQWKDDAGNDFTYELKGAWTEGLRGPDVVIRDQDGKIMKRTKRRIYTSKEMQAALNDHYGEAGQGIMYNMLRYYLRANSLVKIGKTAYSPTAQVRNVFANPHFAIVNGYWRIGKARQSFRYVVDAFRQMDDAQTEAWVSGLVRRRVVGDAARGREIAHIFKNAKESQIDELVGDILATGGRSIAALPGKAARTGLKLYQLGDDLWKVYFYENELARYKRAKPAWSQEELEDEAARIVRNVAPTYSKIPKIVDLIRLIPAVGGFVAFESEMYRTSFHTFKQMIHEAKDPDLRGIAATRLVGITIAVGVRAGLLIMLKDIFKVSNDEEEAMRKMFAHYQTNSELGQFGYDEESEAYAIGILGYTDPAQTFIGPVQAYLRNEDPLQGILDASGEMLDPYISQEILIKKIMGMLTGTKWEDWSDPGRPFINYETDNFIDRSIKRAGHFIEGVMPGVMTEARRKKMALTGEVTKGGTKYGVTAEAVNSAFGLRIQHFHPATAFKFKAIDYAYKIRQIDKGLRADITERGVPVDLTGDIPRDVFGSTVRFEDDRTTMTKERIQEIKVKYEQLRQDAFDKVYKLSDAARTLRVTNYAIKKLLVSAGISQGDAKKIVNGSRPKWTPSENWLKSRIDNLPTLDERNELRRRRRLLK